MQKIVILINGVGGSGKDTVCYMASKSYRIRNISSITPIVQIAKQAGWNGEKTPKARRFLSELKRVFTEWNDLSFSYCQTELAHFLQSDAQILFVHIRETEEIMRFRDAVSIPCYTLLVRRPTACKSLGNRSDDEVEQYPYDFYLENNGTLSDLYRCATANIGALLHHTTPPTVWQCAP